MTAFLTPMSRPHAQPFELSGFAHEMRNSLAPLVSALDIMRCTHGDGDENTRLVEMAQRQVKQMSRLVTDLLDSARFMNGDPELQCVDTTAQHLVEDAVRAWSHAATLRHHRLEVTMPLQPLAVSADPQRIHQVLGNLLGNAIKYTRERGSIQVRVARDGADAVIRVCDNGIGIEPGQLEAMFEPFRQDPRARALSRDGLGLGLAIARRLVELHGGTMKGESRGPEQGSTFTVTLPVNRDRP